MGHGRKDSNQTWIGILRSSLDKNGTDKETLIGAILRSGVTRILRGVQTMTVSVHGEKMLATKGPQYPFLCLVFGPGRHLPRLELEAVDWCEDDTTFAFRTPMGSIVEINTLDPQGYTVIPKKRWPSSYLHLTQENGPFKEVLPGVFQRNS